jgi:3D (Asp-Asp-Asp) domain-containing protein
MRCELSEFIKNLIMCLFILTGIFLSLSVTHVYGIKTVPQTRIARRLERNQNLEITSFAVDTDQTSRTIHYETGKEIVLICDGVEKTFRTCSYQIKNLLKNEKIDLGKEDFISQPLNYVLKEKDLVRIKRVLYKTYNVDEPISYRITSETNELVADGIKVIWQPGEKGTTRYKIREKYEDGILKEKKVLSKTRIKEPVTEIVAYGTGVFNGFYRKKFRMCASSYTPTVEECDSDPFTTASGLRVRFGLVAVDPKVIKLGSRLWVSGYGYAIAADTGGLVKNMKIDLFFWRRLPDGNWKGAYIDVYLLD